MKKGYISPSAKNRHQALSVSPPKGSPVHGEGKISLRVDQPVEGCQVMTHAFFRSVEGDIDDKDVDLQFHWYRSSMRRACANSECPRHGEGNVLLLVAKLECVLCCRMGITRDHSSFCSPDCFRLAWHKHKQLHDNLAALQSTNDSVPWKSQLYHLEALCPQPEERWIEIHEEKYVFAITCAKAPACLMPDLIAL